jgi:hypothetical protein
MANTIVCGILEYENTLRDGGIPETQIRAQTKALAQIIESNLSTKQDLRELELRMIIKIGAMFVAAIGILDFLLKR